VGYWVIPGLFGCFKKMRECLKIIDLRWTMNTKKKEGNLPPEIYSLRNLYIIDWISPNIFCL
jgi:hypothetical protein